MHDNLKVASMDRQLEAKADISTKDLAKHRWHWTLNPANADRMTITAYAKMIGRHFSTIRLHVKAYELHVENPAWPFHECMERAHYGTEKQVVVEEITKAFDKSWGTVRTQEGQLIREVAVRSRDLQERMGITYEDAVKDTVANLKASADRRADEKKVLAENHGVRFVGVENELVKAHNALHRAMVEARETDFTDREREMLIDTIRKISSTTQLVDYAISGNIDVDWDKELAKLDRGVA